MSTLKSLTNSSIPRITIPLSPLHSTNSLHPSILVEKQRKPGSRFVLLAQTSGTEQQDPVIKNGSGSGSGGGDGNNDSGKDERPQFTLRWIELFVDPDPDNILAVGLTGLLTWASVQVLWQIFIVSLAILIAALKYSFIAALLIFILITLL